MAGLRLKSTTVTLRRARRADVPELVAMLAADPVEPAGGDLAPYYAAFDVMDGQEHELLLVAGRGGEVVATLQLTSDNARVDAHRFYQRLKFIASHTGFKLSLPR